MKVGRNRRPRTYRAADGRFLVALEAVDFKGPDPTAAQRVGQATKVMKAQLDRI